MAVALRQIEELYNILTMYVSEDNIGLLLSQLKCTDAYHSNASFAATIDRLYNYWKDKD